MRQDNSIGWRYNERYIHIRDLVAELKGSWSGNWKTIDFLLLTAITAPVGITAFTVRLLYAEYGEKHSTFNLYL